VTRGWYRTSTGLRGFETVAKRPPQPPIALVEEVAQQPSRNHLPYGVSSVAEPWADLQKMELV